MDDWKNLFLPSTKWSHSVLVPVVAVRTEQQRCTKGCRQYAQVQRTITCGRHYFRIEKRSETKWKGEVNCSSVISGAFPKATLPKENKECFISSPTAWRMHSKILKKKKTNSQKLYVCLQLESDISWRHFCTLPAPKFQEELLPSPPVEQTSETHTLQLPMAQSRIPVPSCSGKMNKTEFKISEQRFSWVFAASWPAFIFGCQLCSFWKWKHTGPV